MKMQNVGQGTTGDNQKLDQVNAQEVGKSSTPESSNSSPTKSETDPFSGLQPRYMTDSSVEDEDDVSEVESFVIEQVSEFEEAEARLSSSKFLLNQEEGEQSVDPETQARLEALLEAAGIGKLATGDGKQLADPEVLRRLTSSVSCALDEAAAALTRMRTENTRPQPERTLVEACTDGDVGTVKKLLTEGRSVHETTEEGESLLSLACSAGYYELAQVLLAMHANVEDRGIKGDCTPLMEAASSGYAEIVQLLIHHNADVNAQSTSGNTPLMYACAGGHNDVVKILLDNGANVEDHNENGHTPLMEAASAGHVNVAATLLERGAGINTHSNEFKESALTLACYKGHLDMVRFLLDAGADQEHKTDEMHTALMEASMDGHVEVARLLLDSGAQVNMPTDSFESPLTLAACGGHVDLALLLIERGANIEEVNDEGYTPLMEAAREGHEEMVALLLNNGANINAQTEETQETALTLACCGGFLDVADYLIQKGAEIELGASTPLMEAAQEGHLDLVRYLVEHNANVNAQTQTGDTALTYSCENGHTEVAKLLLQTGADLEHESEGGRTPLMKACRAGHLCTVKFLLSMNANVNKQTANNDHTPLSLAAAGGHIAVVELLLAHQADPFHKLKDNSTMLIEAAKGGHTNVVQLLLDYPHSIMMSGGGAAGVVEGGATPASPTAVTPPDAFSLESLTVLPPPPPVPRHDPADTHYLPKPPIPSCVQKGGGSGPPGQKSLLRKSRLSLVLEAISPHESNHQSNQERSGSLGSVAGVVNESCKEDALDKGGTGNKHHLMIDQQFYQRQQIVEELQRVEEELKEKGVLENSLSPTTSISDFFPPPSSPSLNQGETGNMVDLLCESMGCDGDLVYHDTALVARDSPQLDMVPLPPQALLTNTITLPSEVVQSTAISDRPKAKPTWKKDGKNARKQTAAAFQAAFQHQALAHITDQHIAQALHQQGTQGVQHQGSGQQQCGDDMLFAAMSEGATGVPSGVLTTHIMARVQQQLDFAVAAVGTPAQPDPRNLSNMGGSFASELLTRCALNPGDVAAPDITSDESLLDAVYKSKLSKQDPRFDDKFDLNSIGDLVKRASNELQGTDKMNFHIGVLKNLQKAAVASKVLMPQVGSPLFQVEDQSVPSQPIDQQTALHSIPTIYPSNQTGNFQEQMRNEGFQVGGCQVRSDGLLETKGGRLARPNLVTPPPPPLAPPTQPSQLLLKTPPPPPCDCHASKVDSKEQVQAGTQTSPALLPPPSAAPSSTDALPEPSPNTKSAKKTRYQQKSSHSHQINSYPGSECGGVSGGGVSGGAAPFSCMDVDSATDSNNDTALTLACAGGHEELVELLLSRGANIEHRDKKGFTPLILAATAGHEKVVEILLNHSADMEAQSERTKDTPLSLACSGGRYEVVELLLQRGANKEHRNVSDYTPLSLAASGGYVNIIKLLLSHGAEINSRTGSKLGISPLMLAAMNGHTAAVKLLLDMGSDINAQIETNRNTALTLACFQGRHEVVSLLLDRKANVEHRAKTGLTPLMEAASGGYVEVGRVLLDKGADVNAPPVPSSRDTALTIAADKGHVRFVELLLSRTAQVEVKNKKGNSPLWLAANGGHLAVVELLYNMGADIDSQDNRKVSCLMAAFRKGHIKVVKWMVNHVNQFPSDQEMTRYITTVSDKELLDKCQECIKIIRVAKDQQAAKANKNATILLEELYMEKTREESRRAAAARRRERKKKKKLEKRKMQEENQREEAEGADQDTQEEEPDDAPSIPEMKVNCKVVVSNGGVSPRVSGEPEEGDSGIDANSQGSCSSTEQMKPGDSKKKDRKKKKQAASPLTSPQPNNLHVTNDKRTTVSSVKSNLKTVVESKTEKNESAKVRPTSKPNNSNNNPIKQALVFETRHPADRDDFESTGNDSQSKKKNNYMMYCEEVVQGNKGNNSTSPKMVSRREEGWKEVVRKYLSNTYRSKKVAVPLNAISRVIGRGGSNINAIRTATGAHIEVEKQSKGQGERTITLKGSTEATKQAHSLISALIKDPEVDILQLLPKSAKSAAAVWEKSVNTAKSKPGVKSSTVASTATASSKSVPTGANVSVAPSTAASRGSNYVIPRTAPRLMAAAVKRAGGIKDSVATTPSSTSTKTIMSYTGAIMTSKHNSKGSGGSLCQTFAAKLSESTVTSIASLMSVSQVAVSLGALSTTTSSLSKEATTTCCSHGPVASSTVAVSVAATISPPVVVTSPVSKVPTSSTPAAVIVPTEHAKTPPPEPLPPPPSTPQRSPTPPTAASSPQPAQPTTTLEYSLFNDNFTKVAQQSMWGPRENGNSKGSGACMEKGMNFASVAATGALGVPNMQPTKYLEPTHPQVDASKAPGYRPAACSPVSKGNGGTNVAAVSVVGPPSMSVSGPQVVSSSNSVVTSSSGYFPSTHDQHVPPAPFNRTVYQQDPVEMIQQSFQPQPPQVSMSRLNPRAPDFSSSFKQQMYNYAQGGAALVGTVPLPFPTKFTRPPANGRWHLPPPVYHTQMELLPCTTHQGGEVNLQENGVEDRKPRPIGTERSAWKNNTNQMYQQQQQQELEVGGGSWGGMGGMEGKVGWPQAPIERPPPQHVYRQPQLQFNRIAPHHLPDDLSHIIDTYQGGLEGGLGQFGGVGHSIVGPGHYSSGDPSLHDGMPPCWTAVTDQQRHDLTAPPPTTDKHGWTAKWNH